MSAEKDGAPKRFNFAQAMFQSMKRQRLAENESPSSSKKEEEEQKPEAPEQPDETTELRRKAIAKLKQEAERNAERARTMGTLGYVKPNSLRTNKQFLNRVVQSTKTSRRMDKPISKSKKS
jgi:hypothetical protein